MTENPSPWQHLRKLQPQIITSRAGKTIRILPPPHTHNPPTVESKFCLSLQYGRRPRARGVGAKEKDKVGQHLVLHPDRHSCCRGPLPEGPGGSPASATLCSCPPPALCQSRISAFFACLGNGYEAWRRACALLTSRGKPTQQTSLSSSQQHCRRKSAQLQPRDTPIARLGRMSCISAGHQSEGMPLVP